MLAASGVAETIFGWSCRSIKLIKELVHLCAVKFFNIHDDDVIKTVVFRSSLA